MVDILHRAGINASPRDVYNALTTLDRLAAWWTNDTQGQTEIGGVIKFSFGDRGFFDMKVVELEPEKRVMWEVVDGPKEWIGTKVIWDLSPEGAGTTIRFSSRAGGSPWTSCTTAAPNGPASCSASRHNSKTARAPPVRTIS